ncbi:hypothetical protein WICMUC_005231 [Wickerhamomyces mucosus]|uniref:Double-strand break repair protein n=1 Tax=Wickerhamomyces mucosus TaxID=1378264 RepID=A0A9P8T6H5_9ASCO|nr:hypothetical protein WICMUC_005231 [Wickerhamomyces mucosus]
MPLVPSIEPGEDTISILITTDNHIGYNENDPIIGDDAFKTFREILHIAQSQNVDMILQSGDLFHLSKPSKKSIYQVTKSLREFCYGDKPCELQLLSNPTHVLDDGFDTLNYEDPNINVSIPMFAISGNHDEASGNGLLSPLDILNASGLLNHFGKNSQSDLVEISPILLQKGSTKLSLYGLANIRDERIKRTFEEENVKFKIPENRENEFFNLLCVHQNHHSHTNTAYLPEEYLPNFLDLVIWGHEHECIPYSIPNVNAGFDVLQPGSSIATSLCEGEAIEKKIFVLNIKGLNYSLTPIKLKTVRPFHMDDIKLSQIKNLNPGLAYKTQINEFLMEKVQTLIDEARDEYKQDHPELFPTQDQDQDQNQDQDQIDEELMPLPLIRLRVDYSGGYEVENSRRFSNRFVEKVANVDSVIQFHQKKDNEINVNLNKKHVKLEFSKKNGIDEVNESVSIETYINNYLQNSELILLPELGVSNSIKKLIEKEDKSSIKDYLNFELENQIENFLTQDNELNFEENFKKIIKNVKDQRYKQMMQNGYEKDFQNFKDSTNVQSKTTKTSTGKTTSKSKGRTNSSNKSKEMVVDSNSDSDYDIEQDGKPQVSTRKQPTRNLRAKSQPKQVEDSDVEIVDELQEIVSDSEPEEIPKSIPKKNATTSSTKRGNNKSNAKTSTRNEKTVVTNTIANLLARKKKK